MLQKKTHEKVQKREFFLEYRRDARKAQEPK